MSPSEGLRVGFVGSGWSDRVQIPTFRLGWLTPQAIASASLTNAQRVAAKPSTAEVYTTWQELVASDSVDIVSICTPPHLHAEIAIAALPPAST
jgi:predicted dehydrogenase